MSSIVKVLVPGYSRMIGKDKMRANGSSTLIKSGNLNILVDTLGPWDRDVLVEKLRENGLTPDDINFLVCTHGHPDHVGNLNLFLKAHHIVGQTFYKHNLFEMNTIVKSYPLTAHVDVIASPGHTADDVSVMVRNAEHLGVVVVAGDIFENENDLKDDSIWKNAGSVEPARQSESRKKILSMSNYIVPGHGPMFKVAQGASGQGQV